VNRIRGLLFDKDGTLIDFFATWGAAYRAVADEIAAHLGTAELADRLLIAGGYEPVTGALDPASPLACGTNDEIAALWASLAGTDDVEGLKRRVAQGFHRFGLEPVPVTDLPGLFTRLRARGLRLGVATNDHDAPTRASLSYLGVDGLLDFVAGADTGFGGKPGPGMLHGFCAAVGLEPREVAVIGDTVADVAMARAGTAGLVVGVLTGASRHEALAGIADHVIPTIADLESLLDGLAPSA
jgi:phosphoglycolate phosphatase